MIYLCTAFTETVGVKTCQTCKKVTRLFVVCIFWATKTAKEYKRIKNTFSLKQSDTKYRIL